MILPTFMYKHNSTTGFVCPLAQSFPLCCATAAGWNSSPQALSLSAPLCVLLLHLCVSSRSSKSLWFSLISVSSYRFYFLKTHISSSRRKCGKTSTSCSSSPTPICPFRRTSHHKSILKSLKSCLINTLEYITTNVFNMNMRKMCTDGSFKCCRGMVVCVSR